MDADAQSPYLIDVQVADIYADQVNEQALVRAAAAVLSSEGRKRGELSIVLTDDETVRELNRRYAGEDETTDVLSFSALEGSGFVTAPDAAVYLGDIVIALPYARRQAAQAGHPLADELALLTVHGVLHLLGYDHATAEDKARMWLRQEAILQSLRQSLRDSDEGL